MGSHNCMWYMDGDIKSLNFNNDVFIKTVYTV